jgi:polyribonucleotide nucleotidyltransferase
MDAGVPIKTPVAGIAMGLIKEGDETRILTDNLGAEDHLGDMDFKVCGSREGITAFQMDCKIAGVSRELMHRALLQARDGRLYILDKMAEAIAEPRVDISPYAPRIYTIKIDVDKIRDVIGPGGKIVREIQSKSGADIEIEDDGTINVAAVDKESAEKAIELIKAITAEPEVGQLYKGTVTRIMPFGAFVGIMGNKEGLVHISELDVGHVREVEDVVQVGDEVNVKVIEIDKMGRVNLSKVEAERELGLIDPDAAPPRESHSRPPRDRGGRDRYGGDRGRSNRSGRDRGRGDRSGRDRGRGGPGRDRGRGGSRNAGSRSGSRGGGDSRR